MKIPFILFFVFFVVIPIVLGRRGKRVGKAAAARHSAPPAEKAKSDAEALKSREGIRDNGRTRAADKSRDRGESRGGAFAAYTPEASRDKHAAVSAAETGDAVTAEKKTVRLSPLARGIVLAEIIGKPKSLR